MSANLNLCCIGLKQLHQIFFIKSSKKNQKTTKINNYNNKVCSSTEKMYPKSHYVPRLIPFQPIFYGSTKWRQQQKKRTACKFISNVIAIASVGINLIKITGVHPLLRRDVVLYRGWVLFMLAISCPLIGYRVELHYPCWQ